MLVLKGSEAAARIKKEVQEMVEGLGGHVPTAAIVRVGERPDDLSYERNVMKKIASFGMEAGPLHFRNPSAKGSSRQNSRRSMTILPSTGSCYSVLCRAT